MTGPPQHAAISAYCSAVTWTSITVPVLEISRWLASGKTTAVAWLPAHFAHPRVAVGNGYHLRPITAADNGLDYPAVMGSRQRLWPVYGQAQGWPPASMTYRQDLDDLARRESETAARRSFNYVLFDDAETALLGCVCIAPRRSRAPTPRSPVGRGQSGRHRPGACPGCAGAVVDRLFMFQA